MALIEIKHLKKSFHKESRKIEVLKGVDTRFEEASMVSIIGDSGAGKSTFLHVLGTLDTPTSGQVLFDGQDVFALKPKQLALFRNRSIGFVFQFHHLLPEFTALENVAMPALIGRRAKGLSYEYAEHLLETVGLSERLTHKPGELSGGEQQRVALARALVMKPKLLLADEPTGNLDSKTGQGIHRLFWSLNASLKITICVVTHNEALAQMMPRQMEMVDGRLDDIKKERS